MAWDFLYASLREPKRKFRIPHDPITQSQIISELKTYKFDVVNFYVDEHEYFQYLAQAQYSNYKKYYHGGAKPGFIEKSLEHYLAAKLLAISANDIYVDVANSHSPAPEIYKELYGCIAYKQDLIFPKGIHGNVIGGNAAHMPVSDGFATKMALHCSFEHFEGNSDVAFIKEASRVLRTNGKLCILPLYLFNQYVIQIDPAQYVLSRRGFDSDAVLYCVKNDLGARHGRFYDVDHLKGRIKNNLQDLDMTIYVIANEKQIDPTCYIKFAATFQKKQQHPANNAI